MKLSRRAVLASLLVSPALRAAAAAPLHVRIGVLRFGTVAWELDVVKTHALADAATVEIEPVEFASSPATQVALQSGAVDMIALDWLWVARQRASGADWCFSPLSAAVGALEVPAESPIRSVADLPGKRLGIAGSPLDKSWLILQAYATRKFGIDLDRAAEKSFAAPPLLATELKAGRLDAVLTFWPFAARAEAGGARRVLSVEDALAGLDVAPGLPMVGYVFSERWAKANAAALGAFLAAAQQARGILAGSDAEWQRLAPITGAADAAELLRLRDWYRSGIPGPFGAAEQASAARLFSILAEIGGPDLVGSATRLPPGVFWQSPAP